LLAQHQDIQDKLRSEIRGLFKDNKISDYDAVNALPYLDHVCCETLRLIPTVPQTVRVNRVPVVLGPYVLPKDTIFHIPCVVSHHSKEIWGEDIKEFKPSRWEKTDHIGNPYEYFPFLAGGRQCIGQKFATVELKVLLSILIRDIQFFEKPGFKVQKSQTFVSRPVPNMTLWTKRVSY
jgi:cytochrome P450